MKLKNEKNCREQIRNLPGDQPFHLRIEYKNPQISIFTYNSELQQFKSCISMEQDMDFNGVWVISGTTANVNPDRVFLDSFSYYNPQEKVSVGQNQRYHDAHKKKSEHDMAAFSVHHHTKNLIHNDLSFFNKDTFGEENLLDMLPHQLTNTRKEMSRVLKEMYNNFNYYYDITGPLHNHKSFDN